MSTKDELGTGPAENAEADAADPGRGAVGGRGESEAPGAAADRDGRAAHGPVARGPVPGGSAARGSAAPSPNCTAAPCGPNTDTDELDDIDRRVAVAIDEAKAAAAMFRSRGGSSNGESLHQRLARRTGTGLTSFGLVLEGMESALDADEAERVLSEFPGVRATVVYSPGRAWVTTPDDLPPDVLIEALEEHGIGAYLTRSSLRRRATRLDKKPRRRPAVPTAAHEAAEERVRRREAVQRAEGGHEVLFTARALVTRLRFIVSLILSIPVIAISLNVDWQFDWWQWVCAALTTVVALWGGWPFHRAMLAAMRRRMSALDGASAVAILTAWGWSMGELAFGGAGRIGFTTSPTWFAFTYDRHAPAELFLDVSCGVTVLLLVGRLATRYNRIRTGAALEVLRIPPERQVTVVRKAGKTGKALKPGAPGRPGVQVKTPAPVKDAGPGGRDGAGDGSSGGTGGAVAAAKSAKSGSPEKVRVPIAELRIGEDIVVPPGQIIPVDGSVVGGASLVDARAVGGGPEPIEAKVNSRVFAGSLNLGNRLKVRVARTGSKTRAAAIQRWVQSAIREEDAAHQIAVRSASLLVPWTMMLALVAFGIWWLVSGAAGAAVAVALAILVAVAPVALAMSTSTALRIGILGGAGRGLLIRGADTFHALAQADSVMFNRVGTLTEGEMHVIGVAAAEGENPELVLRVAGALVMESDHPVSTAIIRASRASRDVGAGAGDIPHWIEVAHPGITDDGAFVGQVELPVRADDGEVENRVVEASLWRPKDMSALDEHMAVAALGGGTPLVISWRGKVRGVITVGEDIKPDAVDAIDELEAMGLDTIMITRDPYPVARRFADKLGISRVYAGIIQGRKSATVRSVHAGGETVVMVGGPEVAGCLKVADVGILMADGGGVEALEIEESDAAVLRGTVSSIPEAIHLARDVHRTMDSNIVIAWTYNIAVVVLAIAGLLHPLPAALLMVLSSLWIEWRSRRLARTAGRPVSFRGRWEVVGRGQWPAH